MIRQDWILSKVKNLSIVPKAGVKIGKIGLRCDTTQRKPTVSRRSQAYVEYYSIRSTDISIGKWIFFGRIGDDYTQAI